MHPHTVHTMISLPQTLLESTSLIWISFRKVASLWFSTFVLTDFFSRKNSIIQCVCMVYGVCESVYQYYFACVISTIILIIFLYFVRFVHFVRSFISIPIWRSEWASTYVKSERKHKKKYSVIFFFKTEKILKLFSLHLGLVWSSSYVSLSRNFDSQFARARSPFTAVVGGVIIIL